MAAPQSSGVPLNGSNVSSSNRLAGWFVKMRILSSSSERKAENTHRAIEAIVNHRESVFSRL